MMRQSRVLALVTWVTLWALGCESKEATIERGRDKVKKVVGQPFDTLESAKDSLRGSEDKQKSALEEAEKEIQ